MAFMNATRPASAERHEPLQYSITGVEFQPINFKFMLEFLPGLVSCKVPSMERGPRKDYQCGMGD